MVHGESYVDYDTEHTGWYYFDTYTGAMKHGFSYLRSNGGKWVYYDIFTGKMTYGEQFIDGGWYYLAPHTGAVSYGFVYLSSTQKWVYYDSPTGRMVKGEKAIGSSWYYLDDVTGAVTYGWHDLPAINGIDARTVYYAWPSGKMTYGNQTIYGKRYRFDQNTGGLLPNSPNPRPSRTLPDSLATTISLIELVEGAGRSVRVLGDSIAAGMGSTSYFPDTSNYLFSYKGENFFEPSHSTNSAFNSLRNSLANHGVTMVNASVPGKGSMKLYSELGEQTLGDESAAVVMLGTNDRGAFSPGETIDSFRSYAENYLSLVNRHYQGRMIVVSSIPVVREDYGFSLTRVDDILRQLCEKHGWRFVSGYRSYSYLAEASGIPMSGLYVDGTHPNALGQRILRDMLMQALKV